MKTSFEDLTQKEQDLRDDLAARAMESFIKTGLLSPDPDSDIGEREITFLADMSYEIAENMLIARRLQHSRLSKPNNPKLYDAVA